MSRHMTRPAPSALRRKEGSPMIHEDIGNVVGAVAGAVGSAVGSVMQTGLQRRVAGQARANTFVSQGRIDQMYDVAEKEVVVPSGYTVATDPRTGELICKKTRKRRKRLLTCSDKADIAFLTGTLGKGQLGQAAVTAVLTRCG